MIKNLFILTICFIFMGACTQNTPSMMNTSSVQLSQTTMMEQIPLKELNSHVISSLAEHYRKNGVSDLDITVTYDPASTSFTAMNAVHELGHIKTALKKKNITNVVTQTMAVSNGTASAIVSYDVMQTMAPHDCTVMPGLEDKQTTRFIDGYKFGCSTETMLSKQIARPADLQGNSTLGKREGRRESIVLDGYNRGEPRPALEGIERGDLASD